MLKITLRETYDEPHPPSRTFAVMKVRPFVLESSASVDVSIEQLQSLIIELWRLLPPDARPVPGWPTR